jgi:hypothetical protein
MSKDYSEQTERLNLLIEQLKEASKDGSSEFETYRLYSRFSFASKFPYEPDPNDFFLEDLFVSTITFSIRLQLNFKPLILINKESGFRISTQEFYEFLPEKYKTIFVFYLDLLSEFHQA